MDKDKVISWDGEERVSYDKNAGWYVGLIGVGVALVLVSVLLQWWTFTAVVILSVVALMLYSIRPPRKVKYVLDQKGFMEGEKRYEFAEFKSFGISKTENNYSIVLTPKKRFSLQVRVFFAEKDGERIVDGFGMHLPMAEVKMDILDKIVDFLRI